MILWGLQMKGRKKQGSEITQAKRFTRPRCKKRGVGYKRSRREENDIGLTNDGG